MKIFNPITAGGREGGGFPPPPLCTLEGSNFFSFLITMVHSCEQILAIIFLIHRVGWRTVKRGVAQLGILGGHGGGDWFLSQ